MLIGTCLEPYLFALAQICFLVKLQQDFQSSLLLGGLSATHRPYVRIYGPPHQLPVGVRYSLDHQLSNNATEIFIKYTSLILSQVCSQLVFITYINPFILFYVLPHGLVPLLHTVYPTSSKYCWQNRCFFDSSPEYLSFPGCPAFTIIPNYWTFSFLLNQSEDTSGR